VWHKDGHAVVESIRQRTFNSGALQIAFAQPDDTGQYTCMAANVAGSSSMNTKLTVHGSLLNTNYSFSSITMEKRKDHQEQN
jgi:hypothetical protein